jgi:hypothetical protein
MTSPFSKTEPILSSITCILCENKVNIGSSTQKKCDVGTAIICVVCADADNVIEKLNRKHKQSENINDDYSKLEKIYELKCELCKEPTEVKIKGLRNIGRQDYIRLHCLKC